MDSFDPYYSWLGIPPHERPVSLYRLLGLGNFEPSAEVIENAADRQMVFVRQFSAGPRSNDSQRILNQLSAAKLMLLDPARRATYDAGLAHIVGQPTRAAAPAVVAQAPVQQPTAPVATPAAPVADDAAAALEFAGGATSRRRRANRPASRSAGQQYVIGVSLVGMIGALAAVAYSWHAITQQKKEIEAAQAAIDSANKPGTARPLQVTPTVIEQPNQRVNPRPGVVNRTQPGNLNSQLKKKGPLPASGSNPVSDFDDRLSGGYASPKEPQPESQLTLEAFATRFWSLSLPNSQLLNKSQLEIPQFAAKQLADSDLIYHWKSGDLTGLFKCDRSGNDPYKFHGYGLSLFNGTVPRTFASYSVGKRDGEFRLMDKEYRPVLFANYKADKLEGLLCFCKDGAPALVQMRNNGDASSEWIVAVENNQLAVIGLERDPTNYRILADKVDALLTALDKEHQERTVAYRKWLREEQEAQRKQLAIQLGPEKRRAIAGRGKAQDAAAQREINAIMWQQGRRAGF